MKILALVLVQLVALAPSPQPRPQTPQPDVLVVIWDDVSYWETDEVPTPGLDKLCAQGVRFTRGYAQPACAHSRTSLYRSEWQGTTGGFCGNNVTGPDHRTLPLEITYLPHVMKAAGYKTALFGRWGMGTWPNQTPDTEEYAHAPNLRGFDVARAVLPDGAAACNDQYAGLSNYLRVDDGVVSISTGYTTVETVDEFLAWWTNPATAGPKFAVVSTMDAHKGGFLDLWAVPPAEALPPDFEPLGLGIRNGYLAKVAAADWALYRMLQAVDLSQTFVVMFADNGTPKEVKPPGIPNTKVKFSTYEGGVRVPFAVAGPGVAVGVESHQLVSVVDLIPTLSEVAGGPVVSKEFDGQSFLPAVDERHWPLERDWVYVQRSATNIAAIETQWKMRVRGGIELLYDLVNDPDEEDPIPAETPGYEKIRARLLGHIAEAQS